MTPGQFTEEHGPAETWCGPEVEEYLDLCAEQQVEMDGGQG
jgi:hypothetical protein